MPTFTHIFYGLALLIPIMYFARDRFHYSIAVVFLINNIFGPDLAFLFSFVDPGIHSIIGFTITAIPLSLVFSYLSRFQIENEQGRYKFRIIDTRTRVLSWTDAFLVTAAGGISHFFIDQFFHRELEMNLLPSLKISLETMFEWSGEAYHTMNPIMVIGEFLVVLVLILSPFFFSKGWKETTVVFISATLVALLLMILGSTEIFGGEREYAGIFAIFIYIFIPLFLILYVARHLNEHPRTQIDTSKLSPIIRLRIIAIISTLVALAMVAYGLIALMMTDTIVDAIGGLAVVTPTQIRGLAIYYGSFGTLLLLGSLGLFFKLKIARILAIIGSAYFIIFGFPIGIAAFLFEDDIKTLFGIPKKSSESDHPKLEINEEKHIDE